MKNENRLFYFAVLPGLFIVFIFTYLYFIVFSDSFLGKAIFTVKSLSLVLWPYLWVKFSKIALTGKTGRRVGKSVVYGFIFAMAIAVSALVLYKFLYPVIAPYKNNVMAKMKGFDLNKPFLFILFGFYVFIINSLIEEYYWRYFIFFGLKLKFNAVISASISGLAFMIHHTLILSRYFPVHLNAFFSFLVFIAGFVWCLIYYRSRSIIGPWISHIIVDIVIVAFGYKLLF